MINSNIQNITGLDSNVGMLGPMKLSIHEDGGIIKQFGVETGYLSRGIEGVLCRSSFNMGTVIIEQLESDSAPAYSLAYALAIEELGSIKVPERAISIRLLILELNRIQQAILYLTKISSCLEASYLIDNCLRLGELCNDLFELLSGSRVPFGTIRVGGVSVDASEGFLDKTEAFVKSTRAFKNSLEQNLLSNPVIVKRLCNIAKIERTMIESADVSGPNAWASGVLLDYRENAVNKIYPDTTNLSKAGLSYGGDCLARLNARIKSIELSCSLLENNIKNLPSGAFCAPLAPSFTCKGKARSLVEGPRGLISCFIEADGSGTPQNCEIVSPSTSTLSLCGELLKGESYEDYLLIMCSLDLSAAEIDK